MISIDAGVLSVLLFPKATVPDDFKTGKPIDRARERINALVLALEESGETILIPTPALCEVLVCSRNPNRYMQILQARACFSIRAFGERAAIEVAIRTRAALSAKDKKEGLKSAWQKVKYDRQIIAISKVEGASIIYSLDEDIHSHAKLWNLPVQSISDIAPPMIQETLFMPSDEDADETTPAKTAGAVDIQRSSDGHPEDESGAETAKNTTGENSAEERKEEVTEDQPNTKMADGEAVTASLSPAARAENGEGQKSVPGSGEAKTSSAPPPSIPTLSDVKSETPTSIKPAGDQDGAPGAAPAAIPAPTAHNVSAKERTNNE